MLVSRLFPTEVMQSVGTLSIFFSSELHVADTRRFFECDT